MEDDTRLSRDAYFGIIAAAASVLSTCSRRKVEAVMTVDGRVISTGYNGAPKGFKHCFGDGCMFGGSSCINTIHAEINAITRCREVADTVYCTDTPCINCFKALLAHNPMIKIKWMRVYYDHARDQFVVMHDCHERLERMNLVVLEEVQKHIGFEYDD